MLVLNSNLGGFIRNFVVQFPLDQIIFHLVCVNFSGQKIPDRIERKFKTKLKWDYFPQHLNLLYVLFCP